MADSRAVDDSDMQVSTASAVSPGAWTDGHRVSPDPGTDTLSARAPVPGSDGARCTSAYDAADTAPSPYTVEINRLGSFSSWPVNHPINPRTLAKAGLYYSGESDVVVCFSCRGQLSGWDGRESPVERHFREHRDCEFARELFEKERESKESVYDTDSVIQRTENLNCNDPSLSPFERESVSPPPIVDKRKHQFIRTESFCENPCNTSIQYAQDTVDNTAYVQPSTSPSKQDCVNISFIHTNNLSGPKTWTGAGDISTQPCGKNCPKDLNTEIHRIHTFFGWPDNVPVTPVQLARLGFFYLGVRDKVECAFCGGVLHQWEKGDDPEVEHRRHYPHCPLMQNCATSNVPLVGSGQQTFQTQHNLQWNKFAGHGQQQASYDRVEGVTTERRGRQGPKHPELASEETRYSTYFRWPLYCPISPRKLAQAGFFYTYVDDQVRCFWCDGGLKDWLAGDDPWTEHARWYGEECDFVLSKKGPHYVRTIKDSFPTLAPQVGHVTAEQSWQHQYVGGVPVSVGVNQQNQNNTSNGQNQYDKLFRDAMDSRVVRNVLEMGFAQSDVETVVHRQLKSNGQPFNTLTSLVESLIALEENRESGNCNQQRDTDDTTKGDGKEQEPSTQAAEEPPNSDPEESHEPGEPESVELLRRRLQQMKEERTCKICMTNDACMVFIPCGHLCCCNSCANTMRRRGSTCPLCRARIKHVQRAFLA